MGKLPKNYVFFLSKIQKTAADVKIGGSSH